MRNRKIIFRSLAPLIILLITISVHAQKNNVILTGTAKQYAGFNLVVQHISNFISREVSDIGTVRIDKKGNFKFSTCIDDVTYAFIDLGILRGYIYLEPNTTYEIILPPYTPRPDADKFNPYFKPEKVIIGIKNQDAVKLNKDIYLFDEEYDDLFNKNAFQLFSRQNIKLTNRIISKLDSLYPDNGNKYFANYKHFKYAKLFVLSMKRLERKVIYNYFSDSPVCYENPAYRESFHLLFRNFFSRYIASKKGVDLKNAFNERTSFDTLSLVLSKDSLYNNDEFREAVLLKGLFDAFYSGRFDQDRIISLFEQASSSGTTKKIRELAGSLHNNVTNLRVGSKAPDFSLYSVTGKERSLSSYKGKFVYLNFCNTENYTCKKDFQLLDAIHKRMKRDVTIVSIATDKDKVKLEKFVRSHKYKWDFLFFGDNANVLFNYDITVLPTYFLIDPNGNIMLSPAPSPEEDFVTKFYETLKNYRNKKIRKERPGERSIYEF